MTGPVLSNALPVSVTHLARCRHAFAAIRRDAATGESGRSGRLPAMSPAPRASAVTAADVEAWLAELGLEPLERADREGVASWDLILDGTRRAALRITLILDPTLALICWAHYAPPINDSFRKSYRKLLRWNDELPFVKFSVGEDERPLLVAELPAETVDADALGLALARQLAVADRYHADSADWLKGGGWRETPSTTEEAAGPGSRLLARYADRLAELLDEAQATDDSAAADDVPDDEPAHDPDNAANYATTVPA
jgi:hypothetical protein